MMRLERGRRPTRPGAVLTRLWIASAWLAAVWIAASSPTRAADVFAPATRALMRGQPQAAIEAYEAYLAEQPEGPYAPLAALAAGNVHREALFDADTAIDAYDRVLRDYPASPWASEAARRKGQCLAERERWEAAGTSYERALQLARVASDASDAANPAAQRAEQTEQPNASWINEVSLAAANCYYQLGDRQRVIQTYERVLQSPLPAEARAATLYRLGECYEDAGERTQASAYYRQVLEGYPLAPEFGNALQKRSVIEPHEAMAWEAYEAFAAALGALRQRNPAAALEACNGADPEAGSPVLREHLEFCRVVAETITAGDFTAGLRRLNNVRRRLPRDQVAERMTQTIDQYQQLADLEQEVHRSPDDSTLLERLGRRYLQAGALARAAETLARAVELNPDNDQAYFALGLACANLGDLERAAPAFETYLSRNPNDGNALNAIGYTYINVDPERAIPYFERYAQVSPEEANAHDSLGEGYMRAGRLEDAADQYEQAIAIDPGFTNSYFMLGQVYQQLSETEKAIAAYRRFIELTAGSDPRCAQAEAALGELGATEVM